MTTKSLSSSSHPRLANKPTALSGAIPCSIQKVFGSCRRSFSLWLSAFFGCRPPWHSAVKEQEEEDHRWVAEKRNHRWATWEAEGLDRMCRDQACKSPMYRACPGQIHLDLRLAMRMHDPQCPIWEGIQVDLLPWEALVLPWAVLEVCRTQNDQISKSRLRILRSGRGHRCHRHSIARQSNRLNIKCHPRGRQPESDRIGHHFPAMGTVLRSVT